MLYFSSFPKRCFVSLSCETQCFFSYSSLEQCMLFFLLLSDTSLCFYLIIKTMPFSSFPTQCLFSNKMISSSFPTQNDWTNKSLRSLKFALNLFWLVHHDAAVVLFFVRCRFKLGRLESSLGCLKTFAYLGAQHLCDQILEGAPLLSLTKKSV